MQVARVLGSEDQVTKAKVAAAKSRHFRASVSEGHESPRQEISKQRSSAVVYPVSPQVYAQGLSTPAKGHATLA